MSNIRAPGQKLISVPMNEKFIAQIDAALPVVGYSDRSSFIRDAILEKLRSAGIEISTALSLAPSRTGKGGRPPKPYPPNDSPSAELKEQPPEWGAKTSVGLKPQKPEKKKTKYRVPPDNARQGFGRNYKAK
jgi:hypothetical protein